VPKLSLSVPHQLAPDEACTRLKTLIGDMKAQHADKISAVREEWHGRVGTFSFTVSGFAVSGTLTVSESRVDIDGKLPFAALLFRGKIAAAIRERAERLLA